MSDETNTEVRAAGYCRVCGKALAEPDVRTAQGTVYCAEHVPAAPPPAQRPPAAESSPWTGAPPPEAASVSPGLAFLLGLIPGVGAIYNSQYAKGLIHVVIFGLLISIVSSGIGGLEPLFGMLIGAWCFYMPFEAYHTAKKRQRGETVDEFSSLIPLKAQADGSKIAPIVLIAGGALFLLITLDVVPLYQVVRFWPVILIALGAYLLYSRMTGAKRSAEGDQGDGA